MKKLIFLIFFVLLLSISVTAEDRFKIETTFYENGSVEINEATQIQASRVTSLYELERNYTLEAVNNQDEVEFRKSIPVSFETPIRFEDGGVHDHREAVSRSIFLRYNQNITNFIIYLEDERKASVDLKEELCSLTGPCTDYCDYHDAEVIACTCGDGVCHEHENAEFCPEDCGAEVDYPVNTPDTGLSEYWYYILALIAISIIAGILLLLNRMETEEEKEENNENEFNDFDPNRYKLGGERN